MEVVSGARDERRHRDLRRRTSFAWITADPAVDFEGAVRISRVVIALR